MNAKTPTEVIDEIVSYALYGAGADETPEQQEWAATLLDAAVLLMERYSYEGKMTLEAHQLKANAAGDRAFAEELRKREVERLLNLKPMEVRPNPFETGKANTDENGFPTI